MQGIIRNLFLGSTYNMVDRLGESNLGLSDGVGRGLQTTTRITISMNFHDDLGITYIPSTYLISNAF